MGPRLRMGTRNGMGMRNRMGKGMRLETRTMLGIDFRNRLKKSSKPLNNEKKKKKYIFWHK